MQKQINWNTVKEQDLLKSVENGEWHSADMAKERIAAYTAMAQHSLEKEHIVSVSLPENDFALLKRKSLDTGISPEMLIRSLIHGYTSGKFTVTL